MRRRVLPVPTLPVAPGGEQHEQFHRPPPGLGAGRPDPGRRPDLLGFRGLAARARGADRPQAGLPQRAPERDHARRPLFHGRERVHAHLRPDAQRKSCARLALSARRLYRLRDRGPDRRLGLQPDRRIRDRRLGRSRPAIHHLPSDGRSGSAADARHHRDLDHPRRYHAVGLGRGLLPGPDAQLAGRAGATAADHRRAQQRRGRLSAIPAGPPRDLRRCRRHRRVDVVGAQPHQDRHGDPRRRR